MTEPSTLTKYVPRGTVPEVETVTVNTLGGVTQDASQNGGGGLTPTVIPEVVGCPICGAAFATIPTHPTPPQVNVLKALIVTDKPGVEPPTTTWAVVVGEEKVQKGVVAAAEVA